MDSKRAGSAHAATTVGADGPQDEPVQHQILGGRYRLVSLIGQGGMASVHQGRDEVLGRNVAVKVFHTGPIGSDDEARQQAEARILASLNHPNLVTVFDVGVDKEDIHHRAYLVMELITGEDLRRTNSHAPLTESETKALGRGVAQALAYIHDQGVVHRDVKPGNILIGASSNPRRAEKPKLTDFGIARLVEDAHLTATGQSVGTAAYFSPEQAEGLGATAASDVYSLGLVLLECLTGETAFPGPAAASAAARLHHDPAIPWPDSDWGRLLRDMTQRDPAARPSAKEVSTVLDSEFSEARQSVVPARNVDGDTRTGLPTAAVGVVGPGEDGETTAALTAADATAASMPAASHEAFPITAQQPQQNRRGTPLHTPDEEDEGDRRDGASGSVISSRRRRPGVLQWALIVLLAVLTLLTAAAFLVPALLPGTDSQPIDYPPATGELGELLDDLQESVTP
ncbi:serine/threonine-protein kinase [Arthrobacter tecti]